MAKQFYCAHCGEYLGEMSKGKLKKDVALLCKTCETSRKLMAASKEAKPSSLFGNMFGGGLDL